MLVVDDGSNDKTATVARQLGVEVVTHSINSGVGRAIKTGVYYAMRNGGSIFLTIGADNQRDPVDILRLVQTFSETHRDLVWEDVTCLFGKRAPDGERSEI